ncbi:MAG: hypothetical protein EA394_02705 [Bacteroidia bacterium]|nr:MAG: hypothetical protein EA394_02705 [Bacteroidia bacterium]
MKLICKQNLVILILLLPHFVMGQDLLDIFDDEEEVQTEYAVNTFFSTRVINGQSIEAPYPGDLVFVVSHHFGRLNQGAYELWGLDQATIRLGLDYGINERLSVSVGRSSYQKTFDGFVKYKLLRQQTGQRDIPLTVSLFSGAYLKSLRWPEGSDYSFTQRMSYVQQLLIARRFSRAVSFQLSPAWVHKNLVPTTDDPNDYFVLGMGGRWRITDWAGISMEYFHRFNEPESYDSYHSFSVGIDLDTGGHVFQLHFTNSQPMFEPGFLVDTRGNWLDGDIYFGFHITRTFALR